MNVALNLFFVIVLKMTVNGVAIATVIANAVSSVFLFVKLVKTDQAIRIRKEELRFDGNVFGRIIRIGLPAGVQSAVFSIANIVIQAAINSQSGMYDIHRTKLWCRTVETVSESAAFVYCRGFYRDCGNNYSGAFIG